MPTPIFVLGGAQTDFARSYGREGSEVSDLVADTVSGTLRAALVDPGEVESIHVGNAFGQLFNGQGHLGAMPATVEPALWGVPAARHEGACASGGLALLAAGAEIEAGRYDCVLVLGVEQERNVSGDEAARTLGAAAWVGHEATGETYVWPYMFDRLIDEYDTRYGIDHAHLGAIAELAYRNARDNPNAQTRAWVMGEGSFSEDDVANPVVSGRIRRTDCSQITDGGSGVVLAGPAFAGSWASSRGMSVDDLPRILGWGHRTVGLPYADKVQRSASDTHLMPHVREAIQDAFERSGVVDVFGVDGIETHDCFTSSAYLAIDHFGITGPGESWKAVESGMLERTGEVPLNPSGGLIGGGHPVGATGVRMVLDAAKQVTDAAGDCQVEGARRFATLNIGGSTATTVSFVVGLD